jgi:hypothetical protein
METLNTLPPEYIIVVCKFTYESQGKTRYVPNEVRRFLVGESMQTGEKKVPGLPEKVRKNFGEELAPLYFSLIKYPIKLGKRRLANAAKGAIVIYYTSCVDKEKLKQLYAFLNEELRKYFKSFEIIGGYRIYVE